MMTGAKTNDTSGYGAAEPLEFEIQVLRTRAAKSFDE